MNIDSIRKNLSSMSEDERKDAVALLDALGIKVEQKKKPLRKRGTTVLSPYYERRDVECLLCGNHYSRFFAFIQAEVDGQPFLKAQSITALEYDENTEFPTRISKAQHLNCKSCKERLMALGAEELALRLIALTRGGRKDA